MWHVTLELESYGVRIKREYWAGTYGKGRARHAVDGDGQVFCTKLREQVKRTQNPINCKLCLKELAALRNDYRLQKWQEE